ncbi:hypothetical protein TL16_g07442 [Triparma laevis f. inornata]|uniref:Uncharacterized protein n=2 Tax=Triparma laevis TaxID=1534972 RepID=A0A9W7FQY2_9STRA|nr:hypothetical protein TL16_g07442 [Triparma laevis f. inornata]GMI16391.1 hypothetical protein TrLO_g12283 [Triparma laevis f. longispina]
MSLPIVKYESAYHARSLPFIGDAGSIDFSAKERGLPKSEIFITSDLTQAVAGQGFAVSAVRGKNCQKMVDEDCGVVVDSIVKARNSQKIVVSSISLLNHAIKDEGASKLSQLIKGPNGVGVEVLNLHGNDIGSVGCAAICEAMKSNEIVKELRLSENPIGRNGGYALAEMMEINGSLQRLDCGSCSLTTDNVIAIMSVMRKNELIEKLSIFNVRNFSRQEDLSKHTTRMLEFNNTLVELNFDRNGVGDDGAILFSWTLEHKNNTLRHLSLSGNKIGVVGAESLASLLIRHSNLISLNLANNRICDDGAKAFGSALASNKSLRSLNLKSNSLKDSGLVSIALGMQENSTLSELKLWGNEFGQDSCNEFLALVESRFDYFGVKIDFAPFMVENTYFVAEQQE